MPLKPVGIGRGGGGGQQELIRLQKGETPGKNGSKGEGSYNQSPVPQGEGQGNGSVEG